MPIDTTYKTDGPMGRDYLQIATFANHPAMVDIDPADHDVWIRWGNCTICIHDLDHVRQLAIQLTSVLEWARKNPADPRDEDDRHFKLAKAIIEENETSAEAAE